MNIAIISSEVSPYSKTGGLADVSGSLPGAIFKLGHNVKIFSPFYKTVRGKNIVNTGVKIKINLGGIDYVGELWKENNFYFIKNDLFFSRDELYGKGAKDYGDNYLRFAFFSLASIEALKLLAEDVNIIHCHDWQTGLLPLYLKARYSREEVFSKTATIFTIHNLAYQGLFPKKIMKEIDLPESLYNYKGLEFYGQVSFLKGGLLFADILSTVSRKYSEEIKTLDMGCGLEGVLMERRNDLVGVVNGINYGEWNPEKDRFIAAKYSSDSLAGKARCKDDLKKIFNLPDVGDVPLVGMISRLDPQKGFKIIERAERMLMNLPLQMVFLGKGTKIIETFLKKMAKKYPDKVGIFIGYDEELAHKIEAGSDIYLMPSKYEPCGLNHLYSLKYGTIPVVRATGGLDDTITNYSARTGRGNGFKFRAYSADAMVRTLKKAVLIYNSNKDAWMHLQKKVMKEEYSWEKAAVHYDDLYLRAIRKLETKSMSGKR